MRSCLYCEHFRWTKNDPPGSGSMMVCVRQTRNTRLVNLEGRDYFNEQDLRVAFSQADDCSRFESTEQPALQYGGNLGHF